VRVGTDPDLGRRRPAARWLAPLALLGVVLTGCGGSSEQAGAPAGSSSSPAASASASAPSSRVIGPSAPAFASTSAGSPKGVLSKPDFLIKMNAVCSAIDAQRQALPKAASPTDFATIRLNLTGTLRLVPSLISHAERLTAQFAQRAELEKNWLALERADYAAIKPIADRMVAHSIARDAAKVEEGIYEMAAAPNHNSSLVTYLNDFGLSSCANLHAAS
jgi:hypothetical protein